MLEDKRLIVQLKRGDKEALQKIYMEYKDNLLTIAASLMHDSCAAEDILHDVFVSFAAGIEHFQLRGSLRSYLTTSIVNRVRDNFRRKRHHTVELEQAGQIHADSGDPEHSAESNEESQLMMDALAQLPLEQRETIVLHLNAGMKFKEIARMQGIGLSTVQGRYRYGIEKLQGILKGEMKI